METNNLIMHSYGVYRIVSPAGSIYVGMTMISFEKRLMGHLNSLKRGKHKCSGLQRAYIKYGWPQLTFEVLEDLVDSDESTVLLRERDWWDHYKNLGINIYNARPTGTGSVFHSEETKKKIQQAIPKAPRVMKKCPSCETQFESLKRLKRTYCSAKCGNANRKETGIHTRVSKRDILIASSRGLFKPDMAIYFDCSIQTICDLHRLYKIVTPNRPRKDSRIERKCENCNGKMLIRRYSNQKFCSRKCYYSYLKAVK